MPVYAAEDDPGGQADRLQRLERRMNELAQQQQQMMQRLGETLERQAPMIAPGREGIRRPMAQPGQAGIFRPTPLPEAPAPEGVPVPPLPSGMATKHLKAIAGVLKLFCLIAFLFNILIAIWIYTDIRKRGEGAGIFIALALMAGVPAAIIYAIVRIGDKKT